MLGWFGQAARLYRFDLVVGTVNIAVCLNKYGNAIGLFNTEQMRALLIENVDRNFRRDRYSEAVMLSFDGIGLNSPQDMESG